MFDISTAIAPKIEEGAFMHLLGPDGQPMYDDHKNPVGITMLGRYSRAGLAASRAIGNRRLDQARRTGSSMVSVESGEAELTEVLVACTTGWTFDTLAGEPFSYSPENARRLWSDDRFRRLRIQAEEFFSSEANFTKG